MGHLKESENHLGRSMIIDLNAPKHFNIRQVDHRTIDYIIHKNVKYSLGKKDPKIGELPLKGEKDADKWNGSKLSIGNWFSSVVYYKVRNVVDKDNCMVSTSKNSSKELKMSRDILEFEMHSGEHFKEQKKITRTEMVDNILAAKETILTVSFNKKIDDAHVKEVLGKVSAKDLKDDKKVKTLAKELTAGKEHTMTCHLLEGSDGSLGRLKCLDLKAPHGMNFRQIDLRTVNELIVKNVKYSMK